MDWSDTAPDDVAAEEPDADDEEVVVWASPPLALLRDLQDPPFEDERELSLSDDREVDPPDAPEVVATVVDFGVSSEAVDRPPDALEDVAEAVAVLVALAVETVAFTELVSPETSPLVSLDRDWGASSTAETFTVVVAGSDDAESDVADRFQRLSFDALELDSLDLVSVDADSVDFTVLAVVSLDFTSVEGVALVVSLATAVDVEAVVEEAAGAVVSVVAGVVEAVVVEAGGVVEAAGAGVEAAGAAAGAGAGAGSGVGAGDGVGAAAGGVLFDCTSAGLRPWMLSRPVARALTMAMSPGMTRRRAPPSRVATSTDPSTTCTEAPVGSTVTLKVVPFTTAAR